MISIGNLVLILNKLGHNIQTVAEKDFEEINDKKAKTFIYDIYSIRIKRNIEILNNITQKSLSKVNFKWNIINKEYIEKIINYMKKIKFI